MLSSLRNGFLVRIPIKALAVDSPINKSTPTSLVADSNRAAVFTASPIAV